MGVPNETGWWHGARNERVGMKPKIIFLHGMFLNPKSWKTWVEFFGQRGYESITPGWPDHEGEPAALRRDVPPGLGELGLGDLHRQFSNMVSEEPEPPIVIGHSLGGLLMQKLAADGLIRAGVAICPVAPNRMLAFDWGFLRNSAAITNPFAGDEPYEMTPERFYQTFGNAMTEQASNRAYEEFALHESRKVLRDVMGSEGEIDLKKPHVPMLFIGAELDEIIPPSLVERNAHAYEDQRSHRECTIFSSRGHFICGEPKWQEVAERIDHWLAAHLASVRS